MMGLMRILNRVVFKIAACTLLILSLQACFFSKYNTEIGNFPPDSAVPDMKLTPLPLSAAIVMPASVTGAVFKGSSWCPLPPWMYASVEVAYGKEFERLSMQAFAQVFEKVDYGE